MDHSDHTMPTTTAAAAASTTTAASMGGMSHGSSTGCKISMLWNWNTIDSCFISSTFKINTSGQFAGACLLVFFLVLALEALRRATKEYDRFLLRKNSTTVAPPAKGHCQTGGGGRYRPSVLEQAVRALLHTCTFVTGYFLMLFAMYYNGYLIICIFIGAYLGAFAFQWEAIGGREGQTTAAGEPTVCCG